MALQGRTDVTVCCLTDKNRENLRVSIRNLSLVWDRDWRYPFQIAAAVMRYKPQLVHVHHEFTMYGATTTALLFPLLVVLLRALRKKVVLTIHAVIPHRLVNEQFLAAFKPNFRVPPVLVRLAFAYIYRVSTLLADAVIVHSPGLALALVRDYKVDIRKVYSIPHGVRVPCEMAHESPPDSPWVARLNGRRLILCFGYLTARKGLTLLLEAFSEVAEDYPDWDLVVAGGTLQESYAQELLKHIDRLGLADRVVFTAFVNSGELDYLFRRADIIALPAIYSVSASGPLSLAIGYLKPVVANRVGVFEEDLSDEEDSLLSAPLSSVEMANNLRRLMGDSDLRTRLAQGMRSRRARRTWAQVAEHTVAVYHRVLNRR